MVRYLDSQGFIVRTFFLGQTGTEQFTDSDRDRIQQRNLDVDQQSSDQPPKRWVRKFGWYASATMNQFRDRSLSAPQRAMKSNVAEPAMTLADFRWPWAMTAFAEAVEQFKPDTILVNYVKLAYLLDGLPERTRKKIRCCIDTHDVLHIRDDQFRKRGYSHWISVTREQESAELRKFDVVIAIQPDEAQLLSEMAPNCEVVVCGHSDSMRIEAMVEPGDDNGRLTIGYVGSRNASNADAIGRFLGQAWQAILDWDVEGRHEFVIAGDVCDWLTSDSDFSTVPRVRLLGRVEDLATFYGQIDIAINPVEFGTGLKIKNCEAIAYGKPLLTTTHGMAGLPNACRQSTLTCDSSQEFVETLKSLFGDRKRFERLRNAAIKLSQSAFSDEQVYLRLKQTLLQAK